MPLQGKCLFNIDVFINEAYTALYALLCLKKMRQVHKTDNCVYPYNKKIFGLKINIATLGCIVYEIHLILKDSSNQAKGALETPGLLKRRQKVLKP